MAPCRVVLLRAALFLYAFLGAAANPPALEVGIFVVNVDRVDGRKGYWLGDLSLSWEYQASDFPPDDEPKVGLVNGIVNFADESGSRQIDGLVKRVERESVRLWFIGDYWLFPFDEQELRVPVEVIGKTSDELMIVASSDPETMGITPLQFRGSNSGIGLRRFNTAQYRVNSWKVDADQHHAVGMPYNKSRVTLSIQVRRNSIFFTFDGFFIPVLTIIFSWGSFFIAIEPIMPRVIIVFFCLLGQFVHLNSQLQLLPEGIWCWMFSAFSFSITILSMAGLGNIASGSIAGMNKPENLDLAQAHDQLCLWLVLPEYLVGLFTMWLFMDYHVPLCLVFSCCCLVVHLCAMWHFYREALSRAAKSDIRDLILAGQITLARGQKHRESDVNDAGDGGDDGGGM